MNLLNGFHKLIGSQFWIVVIPQDGKIQFGNGRIGFYGGYSANAVGVINAAMEIL